jgi:hypothetical protein
MAATVTDNTRRVEALRFAASLRGARTMEDTTLWALQHGYFEEMPVGDRVVIRVSEKGIEYADEMIATMPRPVPDLGSLRLVVPGALLALALILRRVLR